MTHGHALVPLLALYGAWFVLQIYGLLARPPLGVESYGWRTEVVFGGEAPPWWDLLNLAVVAPPVVVALMLLRAYERAEGRTRRFRIAMIGGGFVLWWVVAVAAGHPALWSVSWLQALNRVVGITIALGILMAYEPALWLQRRYGLEPFAKPTS